MPIMDTTTHAAAIGSLERGDPFQDGRLPILLRRESLLRHIVSIGAAILPVPSPLVVSIMKGSSSA